jgi:hypothetical protein
MSTANKHGLSRRSVLAGMAAGAGALASGAARAQQSVADFYKDKTIRLIVSSSAGGGYDLRGRLMSRHFSKHMPGNPRVVVENMPGAGSQLAVNYIYNQAPKDGTAMCLFQRSILVTPILRPAEVRFDLGKFNWLGSLGTENGVLAVRGDAPVKKPEDLFTTEITTGMPTGVAVIPEILNAVIKTKLKIITGYPGNNEILLALEQGELQAIGEWTWADIIATKADWLKTGKVVPMLQIGITPHEDIPNVPLAQSFAKTDDDRRIVELFVSQRQLAFPMVLPPEAPHDRVAALRKAFVDMGNDAAFQEESVKAGFGKARLTSGDDTTAFVNKTFGSIPPAVLERIKGLGIQ